MSLTILVNGASGKMGALTVSTLEKNEKFSKVISAGSNDDLADLLKKHQPDIAIDFTLPDCVYANAQTIISHDVRPVIGTSGLDTEQIKKLSELCAAKKLGAIIAPNFCLSAALMMRFASESAKFFSNTEIIEAHHRQKVDAPSATALQTAALIAAANNNSAKTNKNSQAPARGLNHENCQIHSLRLDGCFAEQKVIFSGEGEQLIIEQRASDRQAMMPGLVIACNYVMKLQQLIYGMENVLANH